MAMPFYVPPEQVMKDRADYARKGIARGRSLVALSAADGIVMVAENQSRTLYKISEIYDRIAFAGVGKYNEFEMLRIAGVRQADVKGYSFAREDVNARSLANGYAQTLGQVFTPLGLDPVAGVHPTGAVRLEVELLVLAAGHVEAEDPASALALVEPSEQRNHHETLHGSGQVPTDELAQLVGLPFE